MNIREGENKPYECSSGFYKRIGPNSQKITRTVVLFKDRNGVDVIDRKEVYGSLYEIVDQVMDFVSLHTKVAYEFTGKPQREEIYEYPFEAIRETVINSVMHKDYFEHGHNNSLKFFPNKIRIENIWVKPVHLNKIESI
ncbi:MAG: hypothetical protein ACMUIP_16720 [bacterium]